MPRRLAAIMAADIAAFSALIEADEVGTLNGLAALRRGTVDPAIAPHNGRLVKLMGDGMPVELASVVDVVDCARRIREEAGRRNSDVVAEWRPTHRIGVRLGDLVGVDDDIFGDGVNLAARLQAFAEPGAICVSQQVVDQIGGKLDVAFRDLGEQSLENISRRVRIFSVESGTGARSSAAANTALIMERPAVAVLPFESMSGNADQQYFADCLAEDIITGLSMVRSFPAIARNSSFSFKGRATDVRAIAKALGARCLLQGSVRHAGKRVRIGMQLVNADSAHHCWADRYDRPVGTSSICRTRSPIASWRRSCRSWSTPRSNGRSRVARQTSAPGTGMHGAPPR